MVVSNSLQKKQKDYIRIINDNSCYSYVGRIGGPQTVAYPQWCINSFGSVLHELYHALGFFHEQSRPDRDKYVTINQNNIQSGKEHNFEKYNTDFVTTFGVKYDYNSVMHYHSTAFSKNGKRTIVTKDPKYRDKIGQREKLSSNDLQKLKKMYKCS
ncbi:UNVERIFIED_CONTAM: hypothetical protein RMT77_002793 [Armadillidium vulgare]